MRIKLPLAALCGATFLFFSSATAPSTSATASHPAAPISFGADYLRWRTDYKGFLRDVNNRVNTFLQYNF